MLLISAAAEGEPTEWVQLMPFGRFKGRDGRSWQLDPGEAEAVIAASLERAANADLVVDYDHQSDYAARPGVGGRAPAAGWIKELARRDNGIYGRVEWTSAARQALQASEYRYISPVFLHDRAGGRVRTILRAGLTNTPALELAAVASEQTGDLMDMSKIAQALGLGADATEEQILAAIAEMKAATATASESPDPARYVPVEQVTSLAAELAEVKGWQAKQSAQSAVDAAITAGKVVPALKDWALSYASADPDGFAAYVDKAVAIVEPNAGHKPKIEGDAVALTAEDKAVCASMGLDEAEMLKTKEAQA